MGYLKKYYHMHQQELEEVQCIALLVDSRLGVVSNSVVDGPAL